MIRIGDKLILNNNLKIKDRSIFGRKRILLFELPFLIK